MLKENNPNTYAVLEDNKFSIKNLKGEIIKEIRI
ncbi:hypothetical protein J2Z71_000824 [Peptoniphilus stercorisuis]|uniref:Uncharacterized protein n=1 Tax=Peptoniphilus stercorisuis TaxID=1436965 RepID=A0ABS4KF72_9FIRM|nr:hypothetical protein [Peptoniphilus stercorisuis]